MLSKYINQSQNANEMLAINCDIYVIMKSNKSKCYCDWYMILVFYEENILICVTDVTFFRPTFTLPLFSIRRDLNRIGGLFHKAAWFDNTIKVLRGKPFLLYEVVIDWIWVKILGGGVVQWVYFTKRRYLFEMYNQTK